MTKQDQVISSTPRPDHVMSSGVRYSITFYNEEKFAKKCKKYGADEDAMGFTQHRYQRIGIFAGMGKQSLRETVWHECLHTIFFENGIWFPRHEKAQDLIEEIMVSSMSPAILRLIRDNPSLMAWLLEEDTWRTK